MTNFKRELTHHILPFWIEKMQNRQEGGFYGQIDGRNQLNPVANRGAILNARILWTFSAAYRLMNRHEYLKIAERAYDYIETFFIDKEQGGAYWELDYKGNPVNTKKQTYLQGFMLYGFSEFHRATGDARALERAKEFFRLIEQHRDDSQGGYFEAFTRDWQPIEDMRLSEKDANEKKTMNTHLHILEPYTNLLRIWRDEELITAQRRLIDVFIDKIVDRETHHLYLFFDEAWNLRSSAISYGHDIEASWLLMEAAEILGDNDLIDKIRPISLKIAEAALEGVDAEGGLNYERVNGHTDREKHWWVQAEAVVGFSSAYRNSGNGQFREKALRVWDYIQHHIVDREHGEWHWSCLPDGSINRTEDKAGFWKCPYHNGRMCMEMMELKKPPP